MEVTIYQRIMLVLEDKQVSVNALSKLVDMSQTTLNTQLKGERTLSANVVAKVLVAYPDVSADQPHRLILLLIHNLSIYLSSGYSGVTE